jgi:hypothetical protein
VSVDLTTGETRGDCACALSRRVIGELAPDLIDIFLPGVGLVTRPARWSPEARLASRDRPAGRRA